MKISEGARAYARSFGVDLDALSPVEVEALDVAGAGEVTEADARAVIALFHEGTSAGLTAEEQRRLKAFLDEHSAPWTRPTLDADYLRRHLADRADAFELTARLRRDAAAGRCAAAARVGPAKAPADPGAELRAVEQAIRDAPAQRAARRDAEGRAAALTTRLAADQKTLAGERHEREALQRKVGRDARAPLENLIGMREELARQFERDGADAYQRDNNSEALARLRRRLRNLAALEQEGPRVHGLEAQVLEEGRAVDEARACVPLAPFSDARLSAQKKALLQAQELWDAQSALQESQRELDVVHGLAVRARAAEDAALRGTLAKGTGALAAAEEDGEGRAEAMRLLAKNLAGPEAIVALVDAEQLKARDIQMGFVRRQLVLMQSLMADHVKNLDRDAQSVVDVLSDPTFQEALLAQPVDARTALVGRMLAVLSKSQVGKAYFEREIRPVLEGKPGANLFWKSLVVTGTAVKGVQGAAKGSFKVLGFLGGLIASQHDASKLLDSSLKTALALSGDAGIDELERGVLKFQQLRKPLGDKPTPAQLAQAKDKFRVAMKGTGLAQLADSIDTVSDTLSALAGAVAVAEAFRDPSIKSTLQGIKGTADMAQAGANIASRVVANGGRWATFSKATGSLGSIAGGVLADMERRDSADRGDLGGVVGASVSETGAAVCATGLALDATGIGAAIGLPLNAIGGVMSLVGTLISWIGGDSDTDKWLRENKLLMYSSHSSYAVQHAP
jgi:hypothetical protein